MSPSFAARTRRAIAAPAFRARPARALFLLFALLWLAGCVIRPAATPDPVTYQAAPGAEGRVLQTRDHLTLFGQWWKPAAGEPRAVVLLVHGTMAHSGFYAPWAEYLAANGYAVFGIDLRGWGQSQGFGRRGYVGDADDYSEDVATAWREVKRVYPALPLYLQGESLGGGVAVLADLRGDIPVDGLILNAPGIKGHLGRHMPDWLGSAGLWTIGTVGEAWPNFPVVPLGNRFLFNRIGKAIIFDPDVQKRAWEDPYMTHSALPVSWLTAVKDMSARAQKNLPKLQTPFIVLQGTHDFLVPISASESLMEKAASTDKTAKRYEGMSHCTLHDKGREQVWADIVAWLDARVPPAEPALPQQAALVPATLPPEQRETARLD